MVQGILWHLDNQHQPDSILQERMRLVARATERHPKASTMEKLGSLREREREGKMEECLL